MDLEKELKRINTNLEISMNGICFVYPVILDGEGAWKMSTGIADLGGYPFCLATADCLPEGLSVTDYERVQRLVSQFLLNKEER
ncbi:hypothetical protein LGW63_01925 [Streptococcus mutans]|nr:hypothetical protein [Streptococcus mutans]MCB5060074.1 hypothetical protein [Streptococcus mutans]MCB5074617.1 hypothetical protein [Streptococcus mutans]